MWLLTLDQFVVVGLKCSALLSHVKVRLDRVLRGPGSVSVGLFKRSTTQKSCLRKKKRDKNYPASVQAVSTWVSLVTSSSWSLLAGGDSSSSPLRCTIMTAGAHYRHLSIIFKWAKPKQNKK